MKKTDFPAAGERHPAGIEGMFAVTGSTVSSPSGWHRRDAIFIDDMEVGAVHVREAHGRVSSLTECQGEYVLGKDVEWIARKCFYVPPLAEAEARLMAQGWPDPRGNLAPRAARPMSLGEQVAHAQGVVASWSPEKRASVQLEGGFFHAPSASPKRRRAARP